MTWLDALKVGFAQCFALIPGTSRSGATIIGGMLFGLVAPGRDRVLVLPRRADADRRRAYDLSSTATCSLPTTSACSRVGFAVSFVSAFSASAG